MFQEYGASSLKRRIANGSGFQVNFRDASFCAAAKKAHERQMARAAATRASQPKGVLISGSLVWSAHKSVRQEHGQWRARSAFEARTWPCSRGLAGDIHPCRQPRLSVPVNGNQAPG